MLKNLKNPQNFNVFTIFAGFPGVARVAGVAVKYASEHDQTVINHVMKGFVKSVYIWLAIAEIGTP